VNYREHGAELARKVTKPLTPEQIEGAARILAAVPAEQVA
jgi:hypothetical protein